MTPQELIQVKYSGSVSIVRDYMNICAQTVGILIIGILVWRVLIAYHNKKDKSRFKSTYFESSYSKHWRKQK
jgi:Ni,Fe-hydrogenase I cytochrome b subunit